MKKRWGSSMRAAYIVPYSANYDIYMYAHLYIHIYLYMYIYKDG